MSTIRAGNGEATAQHHYRPLLVQIYFANRPLNGKRSPAYQMCSGKSLPHVMLKRKCLYTENLAYSSRKECTGRLLPV